MGFGIYVPEMAVPQHAVWLAETFEEMSRPNGRGGPNGASAGIG